MGDAVLLMEDGSTWAGKAHGAFSFEGIFGEVVFNTAMCGYEEILTDPSYAGQIVVMSCPHQGNYGITLEDGESPRVHPKGLVARELSSTPSSWRARKSLGEYLEDAMVPILSGVDTRALVKHLRTHGVMKGRLLSGTHAIPPALEELRQLPDTMAFDWVREVSTPVTRHLSTGQPRVVVFDFGCKEGIVRELLQEGCEVILVPSRTSAVDALAHSPDGILLSNGPGDPAVLTSIVREIALLVEKRIPLFGICLGHQLLALALGGRTYKLKFGHRGGNHPVKEVSTGRVLITSHNHGYAVDPDSLPGSVETTFVNLYDGTVEGLRHRDLPVMAVQFHPEGAPGPRDARYLFEEWVNSIRECVATLSPGRPRIQPVPAEAILSLYLKTDKGRHAPTN